MRSPRSTRRPVRLLAVAVVAPLLFAAGAIAPAAATPSEPIPVTVDLTVSATSVVSGAEVTLTAAVTPNGESGLPTGVVEFFVTPVVMNQPSPGPQLRGAASLDGTGAATLVTTASTLPGVPLMSLTVQAVYRGDADFAGASSLLRSIMVADPIVVPPTLPTYAVTLDAPTTMAAGSLTARLTVTVSDGTAPVGVADVNVVPVGAGWDDDPTAHASGAVVDGTVTLVTGPIPAGDYVVYASFRGFGGVTAPLRVTAPIAPAPPASVVLSAPASLASAVGVPTTLSAGVTTTGARPAHASVLVDGVLVATVPMPATGDLIVTVPGLAPGAYTVAIQTAAYDGHLAAASTTVLTVASATAPPLASSTPHGTVRAATAAGSSSVTVTAGGYTPGELVVFYLHSDPIFLGTAFAGADGVATLTAVLPATAPAGAHHVRAIGGTSGVWAEVPITLAAGGTVAAAGAPSLATLPVTGSPASSGVLTALALIAVGTALTVARRRIAGVSRL